MKPDDFEELFTNCADEPIRFPGAIQPHAVLLTLLEPELNIIQVSANVATLFNHAPEALLGQPLHTLLGAESAAAVGSMVGHNNFIDAPPLHVTFNGATFDGLLHRHQGVLVLAFEPLLENFKPPALNGRSSDLGKMLQRLQSVKTLQVLYEISVTKIQAMTGYDRVLIYRFEDEGHGQVIAEAPAPSMELFNGLFFPASDIPEQARALYRTNWLRIIPNAAYEPVPLCPGNDLARQVLREQQAVRARDELVAVVSHDLRNPMTVISMLCGMMQKPFSSDGPHTSRRISSAIDTMQQAAGRMNVLLEDLLDTSKIEAVRYVVKPVALDVGQMFEEAYSLRAPLAMEKGIDLSFNAEPGLQIKGDPERMFQVLSNLIGNAIKFTPRLGNIGISAMSNGEDIVFSVRDSGEGIAPDQLPHVFDRY